MLSIKKNKKFHASRLESSDISCQTNYRQNVEKSTKSKLPTRFHKKHTHQAYHIIYIRISKRASSQPKLHKKTNIITKKYIFQGDFLHIIKIFVQTDAVFSSNIFTLEEKLLTLQT